MKKTKALVLSGGGARGAWGGGLSQALKESGKDWDLYIGTSTGSLLMGLVALGEFSRLKEAYTSMRQSDIFSFNPFDADGKINPFKAGLRVLMGKATFGDSSNLLKQIRKFYTPEDHDKIRKMGKELVACCVSLTTGKTFYASSNDWEWEDFTEWMWASANVPVFMSNLHKRGEIWVDGGVREHLPIKWAIDNGYKVIDCIVHRPNQDLFRVDSFKTPLNTLTRVIDIMSREVSETDIEILLLNSEIRGITASFWYTPDILTTNTLLFDKTKMLEWWEMGYNYYSTGNCRLIKKK